VTPFRDFGAESRRLQREDTGERSPKLGRLVRRKQDDVGDIFSFIGLMHRRSCPQYNELTVPTASEPDFQGELSSGEPRGVKVKTKAVFFDRTAPVCVACFRWPGSFCG